MRSIYADSCVALFIGVILTIVINIVLKVECQGNVDALIPPDRNESSEAVVENNLQVYVLNMRNQPHQTSAQSPPLDIACIEEYSVVSRSYESIDIV